MKVNYLILALASITMFASCTSETDNSVVNGTESTVTFTAQLPGGMSRTFGDGTTAKNLDYAVYDSNGDELQSLRGSATDAFANGLSTTVNLKLINGKTYTVIFWASATNSPYTFDKATGVVTADYTNTVSSDETLDAFYTKISITVSGNQSVTASLTRPFAQLNIGSKDVADAKAASNQTLQAQVTVLGMYTQLDLFTGKAPTNATTSDVVFKYGNLPSNYNTPEAFPVSGYDYIAMNYVIVGADKTTATVKMQISGSTAEPVYGSVPLRSNYRTNIYGDGLVTGTSTYNVTITPAFSSPDDNVQK